MHMRFGAQVRTQNIKIGTKEYALRIHDTWRGDESLSLAKKKASEGSVKQY